MSSSDWEEVKRLAADFQRAQLTTASQRLTERNCIGIINKLIELKLLDVYFTNDGKEYITPQQLSKEIQDELYVNGGRMSLVNLSQILNLNHSIIEEKANELVKSDKNLFNILGQLVTSQYINGLCEELNEKLEQDGVVSLSEQSKIIDLPGEFLQEQVEKRIGKLIHGKQDEGDNSIIYTESFVRRNTGRLRGILSAITKPTPMNHILTKFDSKVPERLLFSIIEKLIGSKRIEGIISGGAGNRSSYFIPAAYSRSQNNWIDGFMSGNGYIDIDAAARLGIADPKSFISKRFSNQDLFFLKTCVLGQTLFTQVKESIEESLVSPGWIDVLSILPMTITDDDAKILLSSLTSALNMADAIVFDTIIVSSKMVRDLRTEFKPFMEEKAEKDINSGRYVQLLNDVRAAEKKLKMAELNAEGDSRSSKKEDRRKKATGGKGGGGTQGRETKTKSTKKKYLAKKDENWSDSEEEKKAIEKEVVKAKKASQIQFLAQNEILKKLEKMDSVKEIEASPELLDSLALHLTSALQDDYQNVIKDAYTVFMSEKCGRKSLDEIKGKLDKLTVLLSLYEAGLSNFEGDTKFQLEKFMLRSFGQEMTSEAVAFALMESGLEEKAQVSDLPSGTLKENLLLLGKSPTLASFKETLESVLPGGKKKLTPNIILNEMTESLWNEMESVGEAKDFALFLHLIVLLMFSIVTNSLLQASGKFVPQVISFLEGKVEKETYEKLRTFQIAVQTFIKSKKKEEEVEATETLSTLTPVLKIIVNDMRKKVGKK